MERIIKFGKTIRNNWKKSAVGAVALCYGAAKVKEKYEIHILMRAACKEAARYGDSLIEFDRNPTLITVILNPVANKRKAKQDFEKYCEPLLHLAGLQIDVVQTTSEGNAKEILETLKGTEAIIVAGGDGTLSESVTGLLRRNDGANQFPLGILPLGRTNTLGERLFPGGKGTEKVKQLIEASMAIIKGNTVWKDAMKIEPIANAEEIPAKPIYALTAIEWGAFKDTFAKKDKYWFYGPFRDYAAFVFNGFKDSITWNCIGSIKFTPPCTGCGNCVQKRPEPPKRWLFFMTNTQATPQQELETVNPECETSDELCFKTSEFKIVTSNIESNGPIPALKVIIGKMNYSYTDFVAEGWRRIKGIDIDNSKAIPARTVEFQPHIEENKEVTIGIDHEEFDLKPVKITLLPKVVKLFCKSGINTEDKI